MKTFFAALLIVCISCSKDAARPTEPTGELLDSIVSIRDPSIGYRAFSSHYFYENNRLSKIASFKDGVPFVESTYIYNASGRIIREESFKDGILVLTQIYEYDNNNRVIKRRFESLTDSSYHKFEYDSAGYVVKYAGYDYENRLGGYFVFENNSKGVLVSREYFDNARGDSFPTGKITSVYDDKINPFYRPELNIALKFSGFGTITSEHNVVKEMNKYGSIGTRHIEYYSNGLPKVRWFEEYAAGADTVYFYYK